MPEVEVKPEETEVAEEAQEETPETTEEDSEDESKESDESEEPEEKPGLEDNSDPAAHVPKADRSWFKKAFGLL